MAPEQLLSWFQVYNSKAFCGRLGNVSHLFIRLCEYHFLIHYPRMILNTTRQSNINGNLRTIYHEICTCIVTHMRHSYKFHDREVSVPYMNLQTVKPDHRIHREWIHTVLSYAESALNTI